MIKEHHREHENDAGREPSFSGQEAFSRPEDAPGPLGNTPVPGDDPVPEKKTQPSSGFGKPNAALNASDPLCTPRTPHAPHTDHTEHAKPAEEEAPAAAEPEEQAERVKWEEQKEREKQEKQEKQEAREPHGPRGGFPGDHRPEAPGPSGAYGTHHAPKTPAPPAMPQAPQEPQASRGTMPRPFRKPQAPVPYPQTPPPRQDAPQAPYGQPPYGGEYPSYPPYPAYPSYPAGQPWGNRPQAPEQQGGWPPPPPPEYRWDYGFYGPGGPPKGSKRGGKAFGALFISIGAVLLIALISAVITVSGKYGLPTAPSQSSSSAGESPSEPEESVPGREDGSSSLPQKEKPSAEPEASYGGIAIEESRREPISAKEIYKQVVESVVGVNTTVKSGENTALSEGSGIVLTKDGLILTNAHVLNYSRDNDVSVVLHDGTEYAASVIGFDKYSDLAVLRISASGLDPAEFGDVSQLEVGDEVFAIGNPGGMSYASSLTGGYISALNRSLKNSAMTFIQTDAAINPGNSGGALVNDCGQVVGINSNKIVSTSYEGMGFAIPVSQVKDIIDNLVTQGYVEGRGRLGVTVLSDGAGLKIQSIEEGSDLYGKAEKGDYILAADGVELTSMDDLYLVLAGHSAGDSVKLKIFDVSENITFQEDVRLLPDKGETQATISPEP